MRSRAISAVIDIGANSGQYARSLRRLGYSGRIVSYEPIPAAFAQLAVASHDDKNWEVRQKAVGGSSKTVTMKIAANSVSSSILEMSQRHVEAAPGSGVVSTVEVQSVGLGEILSEFSGENLLVKIDTQGYERSILESGTGALDSVAIFELEMSFAELYYGQALFRELDSLMINSGFKIASIEEGFFDESTGELLQCDAVYVRAKSI